MVLDRPDAYAYVKHSSLVEHLMLRACILATITLLTATPAVAQAVRDPQTAERFVRMAETRRLPDLVRDARQAPQWRTSGDILVSWAEVGEAAGTFELIAATTGERHLVIAPKLLSDAVEAITGERGVELSNPRFQLSRDGQTLLLDYKGQALRLALDGGAVVAAEASLETRAFVENGALSPDSRRLALGDGGVITVTGEGEAGVVIAEASDNVSWRLAERPWSPDGRYLAIWRDDSSRVERIPVVDYSGVPEVVAMAPYPRAGKALSRSSLHIYDTESGMLTEQGTSAGDDYGWAADWLPDSSAVLVLRMSRDGKRLDLIAHGSGDAAGRLLIRETRPETFVAGLDFALEAWADQVVLTPDGRGMLWASERDGWRNYYRYDFAGTREASVTNADYPVHRVVGFVDGGQSIMTIASPDRVRPYDRLAVTFNARSGSRIRLTEAPGVHTAVLAPSGRYFVDAWSSRNEPRRREIRRATGELGALVSVADASRLATIDWMPPEGFSAVAADGVSQIYGVLFKPRDFDPAKSYAVIDYVYAGPFSPSVPWNFLGNRETLEARALAELGFVVAVIDGRGTPGRGKAFQDASYGRIGEIEIPDHVAALRVAAATRPWMDIERAGIVGHSWGGYFALRAMLTVPEVFRAGYAGAPGAVREDALVNEPYMGSPTTNAEGYARAANEPLASNLTGALKLMHGALDTSAPLSTTLRMTQALIDAGKPFELLVMPGEGHTLEGDAAEYYANDIGHFFLTNLGGPRKAQDPLM